MIRLLGEREKTFCDLQSGNQLPGLGKDNCMGCHARTGGDSSGDNGVFGFRDPVTGTEQIGHVVPIVQDSQARLGISMEITAFCQPFHNSSNALNCMRVSTWDIPKDREEAPSPRSFMGDKLTKSSNLSHCM